MELIEREVRAFSVSRWFKNYEGNFVWMFIRVYSPVLNQERENFWNKLTDIRSLWNDSRCVGGDFNVMRFPRERRNCHRSSTSMRHFSEVVKDLELKDLLYPVDLLLSVEG